MRVRGHTLTGEGAPHDEHGSRISRGTYAAQAGRGRCSCGELSDVLPSGYARKQWHRAHKAEKAGVGR